MRKLALLGVILSSIVLLTGCLDSESFIKSDIWLNITGYQLDDTTNVNTPSTIKLYTSTDNSCVNDLRFEIANTHDTIYRIFALGTYINRGETCFILEKSEDSTYTFTPTQTGKYFFEFYSTDTLVYDSLVVIP